MTTPEPRPVPTRTRESPYRSFLTFDAEAESLDRVVEQLASWLRNRKDWDANLGRVGFHHDGDRELLVVRHEKANARNFRARLTEIVGTNAWRTELTVHVPDRGEGWLLLDVSNDRGQFVDVPGLARNLIQAIDVRDGGDLRLTDSPTVITAAGVEELADDVVCDPDRNGLIFVAGTDDEQPFDPFVTQVGRWTKQVLGQAEVVVLDPAATVEFTTVMGGSAHGVRPWTLRTYRPDVDPARDGDALRHRFLTTKRLASADDRDTARLLGRIARGHAASRTLPAEVTSTANALARVENNYVTDAITAPRQAPAPALPAEPVAPVEPPGPTTGPPDTAERVSAATEPGTVADEASDYLAQISLVKEVLGLDVLDEPTLRDLARRASAQVDTTAVDRVTRQLRDQRERIEYLQEQQQLLQSQLEDAELEHAITHDERTRLEDQVRWLRQRLKEHQDYDGAFAPTPDAEITRYPESHSELLDRLAELEPRGVVFTGDAEKCLHLEEVDQVGRTARVAWEALLVLADYLRARREGEWDGAVEGYLQQTPAGYRTISPEKHAPTETNITKRRFGDERVFPVPETVSPDGRKVMNAHFKLGRLGTIDPRLYYLDDYRGTGRIYVGYIGEHLTNTQTN